MPQPKYRIYRTMRGAAKRVMVLNHQLDGMNAAREAEGKGPSGVDFYRIGTQPNGFNYVVITVMQNGKEYLTA